MKARTQYLINVYVTLNSAGRKDQFRRGRYNDPEHSAIAWGGVHGPLLGCEPSAEELQELVTEGYITVKSNGAVTPTAKAKAARTGSLGSISP